MSGSIYFIRPVGVPGPIKIGFSINVADRLAQLIPASPYPLELIVAIPGDLGLERNIQNCFADVHSHCEWFHPSPRLLKLIDDLKAGMAISDAIDLSDIRGNVLGLTQRATVLRKGKAA